MDISASVRMGLAKSQMTMQELANHLGCRRETVSSWCNGHTKPPVVMHQNISDAFGVPVSEFIKWGE